MSLDLLRVNVHIRRADINHSLFAGCDLAEPLVQGRNFSFSSAVARAKSLVDVPSDPGEIADETLVGSLETVAHVVEQDLSSIQSVFVNDATISDGIKMVQIGELREEVAEG